MTGSSSRAGTIDNERGTTLIEAPYGFVSAVLDAYGSHQHLRIRPDDVWLAILAQFSAYVSGHADELRHKFVNHEGQKGLRLEVSDLSAGSIAAFARLMLDEIGKNIKDSSLVDWFLPSFSTSTENDQISASAMAMGTFQKYFKYTLGILCGIPLVTMMGSVEDWKQLREKVKRLAEFDNAKPYREWVKLLLVVCGNFVQSIENGSDSNMEFWDAVASKIRPSYGCGPQQYYLDGWVAVFSFFDEDGTQQAHVPVEDEGVEPPNLWPTITTDNLVSNIMKVPVIIDDNGAISNSTLFVGQFGYDFIQAEEAKTTRDDKAAHAPIEPGSALSCIQPRNDWMLVHHSAFRLPNILGLIG